MGKDNWGLAPSSGGGGGGDGQGGGGGGPLFMQREEHWRHFDNSVNAVSFGFVATAILISMFLVMAIFERFLRPRSSTPLISSSSSGSAPNHHHRDLEAQAPFNTKLGHPSPKMSIYARGVSVLMPGEKVPTYIAHPAPAPAPAPCPPERILCPPHQHNPSTSSSSTSV